MTRPTLFVITFYHFLVTSTPSFFACPLSLRGGAGSGPNFIPILPPMNETRLLPLFYSPQTEFLTFSPRVSPKSLKTYPGFSLPPKLITLFGRVRPSLVDFYFITKKLSGKTPPRKDGLFEFIHLQIVLFLSLPSPERSFQPPLLFFNHKENKYIYFTYSRDRE